MSLSRTAELELKTLVGWLRERSESEAKPGRERSARLSTPVESYFRDKLGVYVNGIRVPGNFKLL